MASLLFVAGGGVAVVLVLLRALLYFTHHAQEPPALDTAIPFISPLVNVARKGINYFNLQSDLPVYTLRMPGIRIYVVNSTSLIPVIQKQAHTISFAPIQVRAAANIMGVSRTALDIINLDPIGAEGLLMSIHEASHVSLTKGPSLDALNHRAAKALAELLNGEGYFGGEVRGKGLNRWVHETFMIAVTEATYGPENPFRNPDVVDTWHKWLPGLGPMMVNILPAFMMQKYRLARESLAQSFEDYLVNESHLDPGASAFVKQRQHVLSKQGIPLRDRARIEAVSSFALLINSVPTAIWVMYHVFSNPTILNECRQELSAAVHEDLPNNSRTINLSVVHKNCPVLQSTFQEVLRFHASGASTKQIVDDTTLDGTYLLRKGGVVLIPASVQHNLTEVWGSDAGTFNHTRFLPAAKSENRRQRAVAFRAFGGGLGLCPGRHLAAMDIMAFAALAILGFDVKPAKGGGEWVVPSSEQGSQGFTIDQPDFDVDVEICPRWEGRWEFVLGDCEASKSVSTGNGA